jgi:hypothetical protein
MNIVRYISATSRVVTATEKTTSESSGEISLSNVALKFMKNKDQFEREIESRHFFKDSEKIHEYVIGILCSYTHQDDQIFREALLNPCVRAFLSTHYCVVAALL